MPAIDKWSEFMQIDRKMPEHQVVYEALHNMLLLGRFSPGQPMTIKGLTEMLGVGMTPVREAIRRLTSENALKTLGNRRVIVPVLTQKQVDDIYFLRMKIEPELAKRSVKNITKAQIQELSEINEEVTDAIGSGDISKYLERNKTFHFSIYELAETPILMRSVQSLWLQVGPSLRVVCGRYGTANLLDKHSDILQALRDTDPDAAEAAMQEDLQQGIMLVGQPLLHDFDQKMGAS